MNMVCAVVTLETSDERLVSPDTEVAHLRAAIVDALPSLCRVVAVMSETEGKLMIQAHQAACAEAGLSLSKRPPRRRLH